MSSDIAGYAPLLRSALAGSGGDVVANAVLQISAEIQTIQNTLASLSGLQTDQLGNTSIDSLAIRNLTKRTDFYDLPEIQYFSAASYQIIPTGSLVRLNNTSGSTVTLTSTPSIAPGQDGQFLEIVNVGPNTIALQDSRILANSGLGLSETTLLSIPPFITVQFRYSVAAGGWLQIGPPLPPVALGLGPNSTLYLAGFTFSITSGPTTLHWTSGILTYQGIQYLIPSGSTTQQFVYWQLSSPTSFQHTAVPLPALGVDDFVIVELNSSGSGFYNMALNMVRSDGSRIILIGDSIFIVNASGQIVADLDNAGANGGLLETRDSSGTVQVVVAGGATQIQFPTLSPVGGRTNTNTYAPILKIGGTPYYVQLYS